MNMEKICSICGIPKDAEKDFDMKLGKRIKHCRDCRKKMIKRHYNNNVSYYVKKARRNNDAGAKVIDDYKRTLSCVDCGFSFNEYPSVCDFHHLNDGDKTLPLAWARTNGRVKKFFDEIKFCIPLCANCHRIRHEKERQNAYVV